MQYEDTILVQPEDAEKIKHYLHNDPKNKSECLTETILYVTTFPDGMEMDIKVYPVPFDPNSEYNRPWTEAVLVKNDKDLIRTNPQNVFFATWKISYGETLYILHVKEA